MEEIEETQRLLEQATFPSVKAILQSHLDKLTNGDEPPKPVTKATAPVVHAPPMPNVTPASTPPPSAMRHHIQGPTFVPIDAFSWDQGSYNSPIVSVLVDLEGVGEVKDRVTVSFGKHSFDLKVMDLAGRNYRLVNNNLEKDILPEQSSFIVKKNRLVIKLQKVKGEYSYDHWTALSAKKKRDEADAAKAKDPSAGIMDMMKNMYDEGDENMKRIIGEAMLKSQRGEKPDTSMPSMGDMGGL